jgi:hypothetical protein
MIDGGSTVPRRQLGRHLKQAREEAGISLEAAAKELEWSRAKMYRVEGGQAPMRTHDVIAMCGVYGVAPGLTDALVAVARESKSRGWWHSYGDVIPDWFELYVGLEAAAGRIRDYEQMLIPGLLQTREYAAAVYRTASGRTEEAVAQAVALRMERQRLLLARRRPAPPRLDVVIDEAVLHQCIPGNGMRGQLARLVKAAETPRISVRILPRSAGPHRASATGGFILLDFPTVGSRPAEPPTVYSENLTGALYLDKPAEVATYADVWESFSTVALDEEASEDLLTTMLKEYQDA